MKITLNSKLSALFERLEGEVGAPLYLVGGNVRDGLLGKESHDFDFATPASPEILYSVYPDALAFKRFGTVSFSLGESKITIASFRTEGDYVDHRHPSRVSFVTTMEEDFTRRDFTINALYLDSAGNVYDPSGKGLEDMKNHILRFIGDPERRLEEDPLRILRAYRFSLELSFSFEAKTEEALKKKQELVHFLNPQKIKEEVKKAPAPLQEELIQKAGVAFVYNDVEGEA